MIVGPFNEVRRCYMQTSALGPAVEIGTGGPPSPPIPTRQAAPQIANGIAVLVAVADQVTSLGSVFLATFPDWNAWIQVSGASALEDGNRVLSTIRADSPPPVHPAETVPESFDGRWHVHGTQLNIQGDVGIQTSNCGSPCVEREGLSLSLSPDGKRLTAVITSITYINGSTGKPFPDQDPRFPVTVGDSFYFEFVAPHLLKETTLHRAVSPVGSDFGNPYRCGEGLDATLVFNCGA